MSKNTYLAVDTHAIHHGECPYIMVIILMVIVGQGVPRGTRGCDGAPVHRGRVGGHRGQRGNGNVFTAIVMVMVTERLINGEIN